MPFKCSILLKLFVKMLSINVAADLVYASGFSNKWCVDENQKFS